MGSDSSEQKDNQREGTTDQSDFHLDNQSLSFITNRKGQLTQVSDIFCQQLGCTKKEILGLTLEDTGLLTEESRKKIMYRHVSRLIGKHSPFYSFDIKKSDGSAFTLEIESKPLLKNGEIVGEINSVRQGTMKRISDNTWRDEQKIEAKDEPRFKKNEQIRQTEKNIVNHPPKANLYKNDAQIEILRQDVS